MKRARHHDANKQTLNMKSEQTMAIGNETLPNCHHGCVEHMLIVLGLAEVNKFDQKVVPPPFLNESFGTGGLNSFDTA